MKLPKLPNIPASVRVAVLIILTVELGWLLSVCFPELPARGRYFLENVIAIPVFSSLSPSILEVTDPVTTITARVIAIHTPEGLDLDYRTPSGKSFRYTVTASDAPVTMHAPYGIPGVKPPADAPHIFFTDLKPGMPVIVTLNRDLRMYRHGPLAAVKIEVPPAPNALHGTITSASPTSLTVKGSPLASRQWSTGSDESRTYTLTYSPETRIGAVLTNALLQPLTREDLRPDMSITVYAYADTSRETAFTAALIVAEKPASPAASIKSVQ